MNRETAIFFFCRVLCAPRRSLLVRGVLETAGADIATIRLLQRAGALISTVISITRSEDDQGTIWASIMTL